MSKIFEPEHLKDWGAISHWDAEDWGLEKRIS
jgi:hypothetical protein